MKNINLSYLKSKELDSIIEESFPMKIKSLNIFNWSMENESSIRYLLAKAIPINKIDLISYALKYKDKKLLDIAQEKGEKFEFYITNPLILFENFYNKNLNASKDIGFLSHIIDLYTFSDKEKVNFFNAWFIKVNNYLNQKVRSKVNNMEVELQYFNSIIDMFKINGFGLNKEIILKDMENIISNFGHLDMWNYIFNFIDDDFLLHQDKAGNNFLHYFVMWCSNKFYPIFFIEDPVEIVVGSAKSMPLKKPNRNNLYINNNQLNSMMYIVGSTGIGKSSNFYINKNGSIQTVDILKNRHLSFPYDSTVNNFLDVYIKKLLTIKNIKKAMNMKNINGQTPLEIICNQNINSDIILEIKNKIKSIYEFYSLNNVLDKRSFENKKVIKI